MDRKVSERGVYYDLSISPYEMQTPYGEIFKFRSKKKLEIYTREIVKEVKRLEALLSRHDMQGFLPDEIIQLLYKSLYRSLYRHIEG